MIDYQPPGMIRPKAEAFIVNTYNHMITSYSWFAALGLTGDKPTKREYRDEVYGLACHLFEDTGDPREDTIRACQKAVKWHNGTLQACLKGSIVTTYQGVTWDNEVTGEKQLWRKAMDVTDFSEDYHLARGTLDPGFGGVEQRALLEAAAKLIGGSPNVTDTQARIVSAWLRCYGEDEYGAVRRAAAESGVSAQHVSLTLRRVFDQLRPALTAHLKY